MKEFKIEIPEGYEIDKEKSTFENIVFKKKEEVVNCWEDIKCTKGIWINKFSKFIDFNIDPLLYNHDENKNVFLNKKYAKSALALAQISQLLPYYDSNVDWNNSEAKKYCICKYQDTIIIDTWDYYYQPIAFNTQEEAERFLKHNEQLIKDFYML